MQEAAVVLRSQVFLRLPHTLEVLLVPGFFETESLQGMRVSLPTNLSGPTKNSASSARAQHPAYAPGALADYPTLSRMARLQL